ncbi:polyprenyl synthetase family protein [Aquimarina sp. M1]
MDWLKSLYPEVKNILLESVPSYWTDFKLILDTMLREPLSTEVALPLAACRSVGGNAKDAVPLTSALLAISISMRILDDLQDRDRAGRLWEIVGNARAFNYATATQFLTFEILRQANYPLPVFHRIHQSFLSAFLHLSAGQDRDLKGETKDFEAYWTTIEMKTATAYSLACATGAQVGTDNSEWVQACGLFGHHLGLAIQIFNDMESLWDSDSLTDLEQGKVSLPLLYGIAFQHPKKEFLRDLVETNRIKENAKEITKVLTDIDTKQFMIWLALKEREAALNELKVCPNEEGKQVLEAYITGMFGDIEDQLDKSKTEANKD